ncbi:MAG TPA: hypothetical protein VE152_09650 [Acidimicrobiales bacterium]|nr:hypothetical protein [Acidimicrobiales bacterium]
MVGRSGDDTPVHLLYLPRHPVVARRAVAEHLRRHPHLRQPPVEEGSPWTSRLSFAVHDYTGSSPTSGFLVPARPDPEEAHTVEEVEADPRALARWYERNRGAVLRPDTHLGAWLGGAQVGLDVFVYAPRLQEANTLAHQSGQTVYYYASSNPSASSVHPTMDPDVLAYRLAHQPRRVPLGFFRNPTTAGDQILAALKDNRRKQPDREARDPEDPGPEAPTPG